MSPHKISSAEVNEYDQSAMYFLPHIVKTPAQYKNKVK